MFKLKISAEKLPVYTEIHAQPNRNWIKPLKVPKSNKNHSRRGSGLAGEERHSKAFLRGTRNYRLRYYKQWYYGTIIFNT